MSWLVLGVVAALCFTLRIAGPFALRSRSLPPAVGQRLERMVAPMLAGLVAVQVFGRWSLDPRAVGVVVAGLVYWRWRRLPVALVVAAAVTALLRMIM